MEGTVRTEIIVDLHERSYGIFVGENLLLDFASYFEKVGKDRKVFIVCDEAVASTHLPVLQESLNKKSVVYHHLTLPSGERTKDIQYLEKIWNSLCEYKYTRKDLLVAMGGGVIGDLAGFAAATYLRGIEFIQVPTTLLAMVDSSVGGKTGMNNSYGKNLIGSFWQPRLVIADLLTLKTLAKEEVVSALAEVIKYGVIYDSSFFDWLEKNIKGLVAGDLKLLASAVKRSCEIKADVVARDEREGGLRRILNFGHTIGHAVENAAGYGVIRHGEAIAVGMVEESKLGLKEDSAWSDSEHDRLVRLIEAAGLPTRVPAELQLSNEQLLEAARADKKNTDTRIVCMVPSKMGEVLPVSYDAARIEAVFQQMAT